MPRKVYHINGKICTLEQVVAQADSKQVAITFSKGGKNKVEYWILTGDSITNVTAKEFSKIDLPDVTTAERHEQVRELLDQREISRLLKKLESLTCFGRVVDYNVWAKRNDPSNAEKIAYLKERTKR